MNRIFVLSLFVLTLILSACSDNTEEVTDETEDEVVASETESDDELTKLEEENEENQNSNRSELMFDINSKTIQDQLLGTTGGNEDGTFSQSAITNGMSQTEVEEKYGEYDFSVYTGGSAPAFYGNLAVVYSAYAPADETTGNEINPDENYVEYVWYYADITEAELINALGEPDDYNEGGQTMNGLPYYAYQGEGEDGRYYSTGAGTFETPEGYTVSIIKRDIMDENPNISNETTNEEDIPSTEASDSNAKIKDESDYEYLLTEYLHRLATHYNYDNYDDVYYYLKKGSAAYDKIAANKASESFTGHETHSVDLVSMTDLGNGTIQLNADRVYSHDNSNGERIANVNYIVNADTHEVLDFEQVSDNAY